MKKMPKISRQTRETLVMLAKKYEITDFLQGDPSWFMHRVEGKRNRETMAFIASCLSYGARKAFMPRIDFLLKCSHGEPYTWVKDGRFRLDIPNDDACFYRLYTNGMMQKFLSALQKLYNTYGGMDDYIRQYAEISDEMGKKVQAITAIEALCSYFHGEGISGIVPQNTTSCCKRVCMFLRWMVRDASPVDLGLWSELIEKRSLIIPLDTHVARQAARLKLYNGSAATMKSAVFITEQLRKVFPEDPLKGDFALFGYGINNPPKASTEPSTSRKEI